LIDKKLNVCYADVKYVGLLAGATGNLESFWTCTFALIVSCIVFTLDVVLTWTLTAAIEFLFVCLFLCVSLIDFYLLKNSGVIEVLITSGRQIDAVNLAFQFELTEQFPPVPLLQSYLKEAKKVSSSTKPGNVYPSSPNGQVSFSFFYSYIFQVSNAIHALWWWYFFVSLLFMSIESLPPTTLAMSYHAER